MAKPDIDALLNTQPPNPDADIALVKQDGRPTNFYLDWLLSQTDWARTNIVKTDQRIDNVRAESDDAIADFREEVNAVIGPEGALVEQITEIEAKANNATANGQIYFTAVATPAGALAAFAIYLTAGDVFTGMTLVANSDGTASIMFDANHFALNDSGTLKNVFNYLNGVFTFNVPVQIGTVDILAGAVNAPVATTNNTARTIGDTAGTWETIISATHTGASGYVALIHADFEYKKSDGWSGSFDGSWRIRRSDGVVLYGPSPLYNLALYGHESVTRLDTSFNGTFTYEVQVTLDLFATSGTPGADFRRRALMIDLRKR